MRKFYRQLMLIGLTVAVGASLMACGGKKEASTTNKAKKEFIYVPEYQEIQESDDISSFTVSNNIMYYDTWAYDETAQTSSYALKTMDLESKESKTIPFALTDTESISSMKADKDGNLVLIISSSTPGENPDEYTSKFFLKKIDKEGKELLTKDLSDLVSKTDNAYIQYMTLDESGNIFMSNGDSKVWVLDSNGNDLFTIDTTDYISAMGDTKEGKVVASTYENGKMVFREIDLASKALGATYENLPEQNGGFTLMKGNNKGCLISTGNKLYEYDFDKQTSTEILNWIDSDIDSDYVMAFNGLEDGRILAFIRDYSADDSKTEMVYLTKTKSSDIPEKTVLTFGCIYLNQNTKRSIIEFNKTNDKYRINPVEYSTEDYETGLAQMNSDIVSGKSPDIIDLSMGSIKQYMEKGVLEDLYPYFEKDNEIKKENYVQSVLKSYEKDGKLYAIMPTFSISTVVGKTADVGSKMGWTLDDLIALVKSKPEGTEVLSYATKESILSALCLQGTSDFIDWNTGKCSFDSEDFIKVLEFANTFTSDQDYTYDESAPSMPTQIRNGQLLLSSLSINNMETYQMYKLMYGEPITFIGYPASSGSGSSITPGEVLFGISSKSKNKDAAWQFVRSFLTSDYQTKGNMYSFPILTSALDAQFKEAMEPNYTTDESGNQVKATKTSWGYDDANFDIYEATQEEVDAVKALIENVDSTYENNNELNKIVLEEAASFFAGQKTAKDVAGIIQSRVQIYVNENR